MNSMPLYAEFVDLIIHSFLAKDLFFVVRLAYITMLALVTTSTIINEIRIGHYGPVL